MSASANKHEERETGWPPSYFSLFHSEGRKVITFGYEYKADMSQLEKRLARYMALFTLIKSDEVIKKKYERLKAYYDELVEKHRNNEF